MIPKYCILTPQADLLCDVRKLSKPNKKLILPVATASPVEKAH